jgi:phosphoribosylamine-glycine ligase
MKIDAAREIETAAVRVLGVTVRAATLGEATARAYEAVGKIRFYEMQYRKELSAAR